MVRDYLQMMGIETDVNSSDSFNAEMPVATEAAALTIPGIGRLKCRAVFQGDKVCPITPAAWDDRMIYVVVRLETENHQGVLLGFLPTAATRELQLE